MIKTRTLSRILVVTMVGRLRLILGLLFGVVNLTSHAFGQIEAFKDAISRDEQAIKDFMEIEQFFFRGAGFAFTKSREPAKVYYGSSEFGYFESHSFRIKAERVLIDLVPPYYDRPIHFYGEDSEKKLYILGQKSYSATYPLVLKNNITANVTGGPFTAPFLLISGFYLREDFSGRSYAITKDGEEVFLQSRKAYGLVVMLNRFGEIVMAMNPHRGDDLQTGTFMTKPIEGGFASIFKRGNARFVALDYDGKTMAEAANTEAINKLFFHHDFIFDPSDQKLITFSSRLVNQTNSSEKTIVDDVVEFYLKGDPQAKTLFRVSDHFDLAKENPILEEGANYYNMGDGFPRVSHDFTHMNFIEDLGQDQLLIGIRNLSKIVLFNYKTNKVVWSFGRSTDDTFKNIGKNGFIHGHTPRLRDGTNLTIFDNGKSEKRSRVVSYDLDFEHKKVSVRWMYYPSTAFFSAERSSVSYLKNGNIVVLFTMPIQPDKTQYPPKDYIYEYNPINRQELTAMELVLRSVSHTIRAYPLDSLNRDHYLGLDWRPNMSAN